MNADNLTVKHVLRFARIAGGCGEAKRFLKQLPQDMPAREAYEHSGVPWGWIEWLYYAIGIDEQYAELWRCLDEVDQDARGSASMILDKTLEPYIRARSYGFRIARLCETHGKITHAQFLQLFQRHRARYDERTYDLRRAYYAAVDRIEKEHHRAMKLPYEIVVEALVREFNTRLLELVDQRAQYRKELARRHWMSPAC